MRKTLTEFVDFWKVAALTEKQGYQLHFIELCDILGEPRPTDNDHDGERYTFEKHVNKTDGRKGFADVWFRDHFAWEYKGPHKDLKAAYKQLNDYREDLLNPPLLVVSDFDRFEVHTNFANTKKRIYAFNLSDIERNQVTATCPLPPLEVLHALFGDYRVLHPNSTDARVTQEVAILFTRLAESLELEQRNLNATKEQIAHFLMRLLFCLFADSIGLLPKHLFRNLLQSDERFNVKKFLRKLSLLFAAMAERDGIFGEYSIKYFNGGLFDSDSIIALDAADIGILNRVAVNYDWSHIAPAIFGTLFERSLDPERRSLIGAHYTSEEDILLLIEPVVMRPLQQRWAHVRDSILVTLGLPTEPATEAVILSEARSAQSKDPDALNPADTARTFLPTKPKRTAPKSLLTSNPEAERLLATWFDELAAVCILDPACGSGNFLYVALRRLLDLWKEAQDFAAHHNIQIAITYAVQKMPSPSQLFGIETEFYAHELASIVVWIGFLQWKHEHNILEHGDPILQKLSNIQHADAIMRYDESQKSDEHPNGKPYEPTWAAADFIIGNPPFLGGQEMLEDLSEKYVHDLRQVYEGRVPGGADLCTYWFEKARQQVKSGKASRVGLLATQSIRGGSNRTVLQRIKDSGDIFWAISDRLWKKTDSRKGEKKAMVQISMVGFDDGSQFEKILDGEVVTEIHPNLRSGLNTTTAHKLKENRGIAFQGPVKVGKFELKNDQAHKMFRMQNPHEKPNTDVIKPWLNANDMKLRPSHRFIIDFNSLDLEAAALYEAPFEYVKKVVKPKRDKNKNKKRREEWWKLGRTGAALKRAQRPLTRLLITGRVGKHRVFLWQDRETVPDSAIVAFARDDDYFFGVLQSKVHEVWARAQGTQLRDVKSGFRYTPKSTFETFPLPWVPKKEPSEDADDRVKAIGDAARELVRLRDNWLNPADATAEELKKLTFTNLYTENPTWLENAHRALDEAVFAAYGWPSSLTPQQILANLLALNHQRAAPANPPH